MIHCDTSIVYVAIYACNKTDKISSLTDYSCGNANSTILLKFMRVDASDYCNTPNIIVIPDISIH